MSATRRVAISTPVTLSNRLMTVTKMTAIRSPDSEISVLQGKPDRLSGRHGMINGAGG
jgi:hypothetical protein